MSWSRRFERFSRRLRRKASAESRTVKAVENRVVRQLQRERVVRKQQVGTEFDRQVGSGPPSAKSSAPSRRRPRPAKLASVPSKVGQPANNETDCRSLPEPKVSAKTARIRAQIRKRQQTLQRNKDLSTGTLVGGSAVSRGSKRTRGAQSLIKIESSCWFEIHFGCRRVGRSPVPSVERAQSAMSERWHTAVPVLRLMTVSDVNSNCAESVERDIPIHGGVDNVVHRCR